MGKLQKQQQTSSFGSQDSFIFIGGTFNLPTPTRKIMESRNSTPDKDNLAEKAPEASNGGDAGLAAKEGEKKNFFSKLKALWAGLDLDVPTVLTMAKGGLPPAISMAMYRCRPNIYGI